MMDFNDLNSKVVLNEEKSPVLISLPESTVTTNELCYSKHDYCAPVFAKSSNSNYTKCVKNSVSEIEKPIEKRNNTAASSTSDAFLYKSPTLTEDSIVNSIYSLDKKSFSNRNCFSKEEANWCRYSWASGPYNSAIFKKMCLVNSKIADDIDNNDDDDFIFQFDNTSNASAEKEKLKYSATTSASTSACTNAGARARARASTSAGTIAGTSASTNAGTSVSNSASASTSSDEKSATGGCKHQNHAVASSSSNKGSNSRKMEIRSDLEELTGSGDEVRSDNSSDSPQPDCDIDFSTKNDLGVASSSKSQNISLSVTDNSNGDLHNGEDSFSDNNDSDSASMELCNERFLAKGNRLFNIHNEDMDWEEYNTQSALLYSYNLRHVNYNMSPDKTVHLPLLPNVEFQKTIPEYLMAYSEEVERVMIWSEFDACRKQVTQIGTSACGATAVINVLMSFNMEYDKKVIEDNICTRYRAETSPIAQYLISRSAAGTTHEELITGIDKITNGQVYGRFFPTYPARDVELVSWLMHWIKKGAAPIATLNLQNSCREQSIPDAWHHQMIFGVETNGVFLTNPLERVPAHLFKHYVCSDSVLLIRRCDVICRWDNECDLSPLILEGPRWREMNVLGQVINVLRESTRPWIPGHRRYLMSHVKIPAAYKAGITLFVRKDSEAYQDLISSPELPLEKPKTFADTFSNLTK